MEIEKTIFLHELKCWTKIRIGPKIQILVKNYAEKSKCFALIEVISNSEILCKKINFG